MNFDDTPEESQFRTAVRSFIQTEAPKPKKGDSYTDARKAKYMILLTRTVPDAPKHRGITYFILDMKTPGVEVRPLTNLGGAHEFNEVFFDNVRIPKDNVIGEENRGWYAAVTTLDFERS